MEFAIAVFLRGGLGFLFGLLFGIGALVFVFWVTPQIWVPPMWLLVIVTGIGSSIAAFLAFLKPEATWRVIGTGLVLALIGGLAGGWVGFFYAKVFYPEGVRNVMLVATSVRSPAVMPFITFASIFSTGLAAIYYTFRFWHYHEV